MDLERGDLADKNVAIIIVIVLRELTSTTSPENMKLKLTIEASQGIDRVSG